MLFQVALNFLEKDFNFWFNDSESQSQKLFKKSYEFFIEFKEVKSIFESLYFKVSLITVSKSDIGMRKPSDLRSNQVKKDVGKNTCCKNPNRL